jgi:hypothetical protein
MLRAFALPCLGLILASCTSSVPEDVYTVDEIKRDISAPVSALDGKSVAVIGWLGDCGGNDCGLYPSQRDARIVDEGDSSSREWNDALDRRLSIGGNDGFDRLASTMQHSQVIVRGTINAQWHRPAGASGNKFGCLDRCNDIQPESIELLVG